MKTFLNHTLLAAGLCLYSIVPVHAQDELPVEDPAIANPAEAAPDTSEPIPFDEIRTFAEVFAKVKSDYVEDVNDRKLIESAIRGLLEGLDPHSAYLDKEAFESLQEGTSGEFGGLGIEVSVENGFVKVISPIDDSPAQKAGIKAGDLIIRLDDMPVKGMPLNDAVAKMRGKPGTDISITIAREGEELPENDFPDLVQTLEKTLDKSPTFEMDFKAVALLQKSMTKIVEDVVEPGWVKLSFENGKNYGKLKWEYGDLVEWQQYEEEQFAIEANRVMNEIVRRHENYKINYNNLFGEDAYEKLYGYRTSEHDASETESEYYSSDDE
jgi:membrane-associated protease RseP (regulator of RpoE activity)